MDYFYFGDFDSRNYGMWLHNGGANARQRQLFAEKTSVTDRILGRSGEVLFDQYYTVKTFTLDVFVNREMTESDFKQIAIHLGQLGQKNLVLSYELYKYYEVILDEQATINEYVNGGIIQTLTFKAINPFGKSRWVTSAIDGIDYDEEFFYDSGLLYAEDMTPYKYTNMTNNQQFTIYHGGNTNFAFPNFIFTGSASTLKIEQYSDSSYTTKINEFSYGAFSGTLQINSNLNNTFLNGVMNNLTFNGNYIALNGVTTPRFVKNGTIQNISGTNVQLEATTAPSDNAYNGFIIYAFNKKKCISERRTIIDYVGATRTAILDSAFINIEPEDEYNIYNPVDGKNYFKLTGTGFVNLGLTVEFQYIYM